MPKQDRQPPRLLSINYHADTNRVLAKLLGLHGYQVSTALSLDEAQQVLNAQSIDLILCRITASDGDGAAFIERIYRERRIPSLAIAGSPENQSRAARLSPEAMRGILGIPMDVTTLLSAITAALGRSRRRVGVCPDCDGHGTILLLTSRKPCQSCNGSGLEIPSRHAARQSSTTSAK